MVGILDLLPLLFKTAPAVKYGMQGVNYGPQKDILQQMQRLASAQTDMSNPLFQNIYQQNRQAGQQNLAESVAEIQRQNRMAQSMGRNPLLSAERGGEDIFRNLTKGYQDVQNTARDSTFEQLGRGSAALAPIYQGYGQMAQGQAMNNGMKIGAYGSIGEALQGLFGLNKQKPQPTSQNTVNSYNMPLPPEMQQRGPSIGWNGVGLPQW